MHVHSWANVIWNNFQFNCSIYSFVFPKPYSALRFHVEKSNIGMSTSMSQTTSYHQLNPESSEKNAEQFIKACKKWFTRHRTIDGVFISIKNRFFTTKKTKIGGMRDEKKTETTKKTENGQCTSSTYYSNYPEKRKI